LQIATATDVMNTITEGDNMNFLKNLFQSLLGDNGSNALQKLSASLDSSKTKPKLQRTVQANSKSIGLTPDQLTEALRWLSLY
jgi:hypothetical protein